MSFSIDKIYVINLDARVDKWQASLYCFYKFGVPCSKVERFPALLSNQDIQSMTYVDVLELIVADGFDGWGGFLNQAYKKMKSDNYFSWTTHPANYASIWSKLSLLRYIVESGENALFMTDSFFIVRNDKLGINNFEDLTHVCNKLLNKEEQGFKSLNLASLYRTSEPRFALSTSVKGICSPGCIYSMSACILSLECAKEMLDFWSVHPCHPDRLFSKMFNAGMDLSAYYFCLHSPLLFDADRFAARSNYPFFLTDKIVDKDFNNVHHDVDPNNVFMDKVKNERKKARKLNIKHEW